jgi:hypothetical protein
MRESLNGRKPSATISHALKVAIHGAKAPLQPSPVSSTAQGLVRGGTSKMAGEHRGHRRLEVRRRDVASISNCRCRECGNRLRHVRETVSSRLL